MKPAAVPISADFVSDTVTRPDAAMLAAMTAATLGDEQREGDPTTDRLCAEVAALLGKEAGLYLPSGTLCNLVAIAVHCRPGDAIIAERTAHAVNSELGGLSAVAGALALTLDGHRGQFTVEAVEAALAGLSGSRAPRARLLLVEQTHNRGGGAVWPVEALDVLGRAARARGLATHMDGARLLNAEVASGHPAARHAAQFDTVWLDLSKGLGCPAGAVLCGGADFIAEADIWKRRLGGALRQSGLLAAAGLHALHGYPERLAADHALARKLAERLRGLPGLRLLHEPIETNLVFVEFPETGRPASAIAAALRAQGIRIGLEGPRTARLVTHRDLRPGDIDLLIDALAPLCEEA